MTLANGMGASPLTWSEIGEWQRQTYVELSPWEARLIRKLSIAYVAMHSKAGDENCPPPWKREVTERERDVEEAGLRALLG